LIYLKELLFYMRFRLWIIVILSFTFLVVLQTRRVLANRDFQIPTVSVPTVTSSPNVATIVVTLEQDQINVRSGPNTNYPVVGVLIAGQRVPALGRTVGGDWIQIAYPGVPGGVAWVYSPLVTVEGSLPLVEPPPTPTPKTTPTVDPTLAAQFIMELPATRLPTFTAPPALAIPTFVNVETTTDTGRIPMGLLIVGLSVIGAFGMVISLLQGR
jgi:hypothetical protein